MSAIGVNCRIGSERHRLNLQDGHSFCDNAAAAMPYTTILARVLQASSDP